MLRWFLFFSRWPLWALHLLGSFGGWAAWLLSGPYRSRFLANVRQAGLDGPAVLGAVGQAGRMTAELPRLWLGRTPHLEWADDRAAAQAYAEGQGVLFLTPHMGCFEVTAQALAFEPATGALYVGVGNELRRMDPNTGALVDVTSLQHAAGVILPLRNR